jgi:hypothetical protein
MENKDKVDALIWNDHPIITRELCAVTGLKNLWLWFSSATWLQESLQNGVAENAKHITQNSLRKYLCRTSPVQ